MHLQTSKHTKDIGALQKGADFVKAFALGFDVNVRSDSCLCHLLLLIFSVRIPLPFFDLTIYISIHLRSKT